MEIYDDKLAAAHAEIKKLKEELGEKAFVVSGLEKEIETARKEIEVSSSLITQLDNGVDNSLVFNYCVCRCLLHML